MQAQAAEALERFSASIKLRKHWINLGTHLACIFSAILHENSLKYIKYSCVIFMQSDEKSVCAICIPDLISASLTFTTGLKKRLRHRKIIITF